MAYVGTESRETNSYDDARSSVGESSEIEDNSSSL